MAKKGKRGAPVKTCSKCGAACHARKRECPDCGYAFPTKEKAAPSLFPLETESTPAPAAATKSASSNEFRYVLETERQKLLNKLAAIDKLLEE